MSESNEITIRIWRCDQCNGVHMDCPQLGADNNTEWVHFDEEDAVGYILEKIADGELKLDDNDK